MSTSKRAFDPTSAAPTLFYVGPGYLLDVPARDLSDNDLARIAFERASKRPDLHADMPDAALTAVREDLLASGHYRATQPKEQAS